VQTLKCPLSVSPRVLVVVLLRLSNAS
jgi:hypothetical protein